MFRRPASDDEDDIYSSKSSSIKPMPSESSQKEEEEQLSKNLSDCGPSMGHALATDIIEAESMGDMMTSTLKNVMDVSETSQKKKEPSEDSLANQSEGVMSHDEMNALAAKIIKAEVMGNMDKVTKLKSKLEKARALAARSAVINKHQSKTVAIGVSKLHKKRQQTIEAQEMLNNKFDTGDGTVGTSSKDERRKRYRGDDTEKQSKELRKKQAKFERSLESCEGCNASKDNSTLVYDSGKIVVSVTKRNILDGNHFYIVPKEHSISTVDLDDDVYEELNKIKKAFIQVYSKQNKSILFYEINKNDNKHMTIGGIPMDKNAVTNSRRLLQNSFELNAEEGATSSFFKDLTDVSGGLRRFLRPGISYTWFGFDEERGYAYRLNDPEEFSNDFYYSTIGAEIDDDFDDMQLRFKLTPDVVKKNRDDLRKELESVLS